MVSNLRLYSETLLRNMQRFVEIGDSHGAQIIRNSCAGCVGHLAVLCDFIGRLEPNSKPQMDDICDWSLERLGDLTQGMHFDEYTYLDLLLKVCRWADCPWRKKVHTVFALVRSRGKDRWSCSIRE